MQRDFNDLVQFLLLGFCLKSTLFETTIYALKYKLFFIMQEKSPAILPPVMHDKHPTEFPKPFLRQTQVFLYKNPALKRDQHTSTTGLSTFLFPSTAHKLRVPLPGDKTWTLTSRKIPLPAVSGACRKTNAEMHPRILAGAFSSAAQI